MRIGNPVTNTRALRPQCPIEVEDCPFSRRTVCLVEMNDLGHHRIPLLCLLVHAWRRVTFVQFAVDLYLHAGLTGMNLHEKRT